MKMNNLFIAFAAVLIFVSVLKADTILLSDGTYLVGKVIRWDENHIIIKNSHGVFAIKKNQLVKLYITGSQFEDIKLHKTLGNVMKDEDIISNYLAGVEGLPPGGIDKNELESGIKNDNLSKKLRLLFSYYHVMGPLADVVPSAWGGSLGYSQPFSDSAAFWVPKFYIEPEYILFKGDKSTVNDLSLYIGPRWDLKISGGRWGNIFLHALPGVTYLKIKDEDYNGTSSTISAKVSSGYEYPFGNFMGVLNLSYLYVYDKRILLHGAGLSIGAVYKF